VQQALNGIYGVDLNPFAVAIARFRLLIAALKACAETSLAEAPNFRFNLAAGDSLLHGPRLGHGQLALGGEAENLGRGALAHAFASEDLPTSTASSASVTTPSSAIRPTSPSRTRR
jgi:hypothetical protein